MLGLGLYYIFIVGGTVAIIAGIIMVLGFAYSRNSKAINETVSEWLK